MLLVYNFRLYYSRRKCINRNGFVASIFKAKTKAGCLPGQSQDHSVTESKDVGLTSNSNANLYVSALN